MRPTRREPALILRPASAERGSRIVPVETPVAVEIDGLGYAVMMMTPADLPAFATGFLLTERLIDGPADLLDVEPFETEAGLILRLTLEERCRGRIHDRVRHRSSDTSCGLCGLSGLEQLRRPVGEVHARPSATSAALFSALDAIREHQPLNRLTGALHAAAACDRNGHVLAAYEDVGRHNALDKLIGYLSCDSANLVDFLLTTSRLSFEMVDKALVAGAPMLVGVSAATSLAIDHARAHGLTLVALARSDAMLVLNDPWDTFAAGSGGGT